MSFATSLLIEDLWFSYSSAVPILEDVSFTLGPGWTGVVGANGSGKTTLLRLIAGELQSRRGDVRLPSTLAAILCEQTVETMIPAIESFAKGTTGDIKRWLGRLGLNPPNLRRWHTLSPGERKRWQIGAALAVRPDVLMLDEPTNHLDAEARDLLLDALADFPGIGLVVSHDREVLNDLCIRTAVVRNRSVEVHSGGYDTARAAWVAADAARTEERQALRSEQRKLERRIADQRRAAATKAARHRRSVRRAGPADPDARSMERKARHAAGAAAGEQRRRTDRARAERIEETLATDDVVRAIGRSVTFGYEPPRKPTLLSYRGPLAAGATTLVPDVSVTLERADRIWLCGRNGAGKTTLMDNLVAGSKLPPLRLVHLAQELTEADARETLDDVHSLPPEPRGRVLSLLAALGADPERVLASDLPSPGEARKLRIAFGLGAHAWALLLDEPTNHLDLPTIERLETALRAFPGALVVVTHDERFATATTHNRWVLADGALTVSA